MAKMLEERSFGIDGDEPGGVQITAIWRSGKSKVG
jgi:hypothetical protein